MNLDGESILFDDLGAATPRYLCVQGVWILNLPATLLGLSKMSQMHALSHRQILRRKPSKKQRKLWRVSDKVEEVTKMPPLPPPAIQTFEKHYPRAHSTIQSHADLFFKITTPVPQRRCRWGSLKMNTPGHSSDIIHLHMMRATVMVMMARAAMRLIILPFWLNVLLSEAYPKSSNN